MVEGRPRGSDKSAGVDGSFHWVCGIAVIGVAAETEEREGNDRCWECRCEVEVGSCCSLCFCFSFLSLLLFSLTFHEMGVSLSLSEKKMEEDDRLRTLECLRGRLLAERVASRTAKEDAEFMSNKVFF